MSPTRHDRPRDGGRNMSSDEQISVPFQIDGEEFVLELNDIRSIEVIDLENPQPTSIAPGNILDAINKAPVTRPQGLSQDDKTFLSHVFEELKMAEPMGPDYVKPPKALAVNNFD